MDGCLFGSQASGELELAVTGPRVSSRHTAIGGSSKLVGAMLLNFRQLFVHRAQYESEPPVHSTRYCPIGHGASLHERRARGCGT